MNWKNEAIHKLKQYKHMCQCLASIPRELERLELAYQSLQGKQLQAVSTPAGFSRSREDAALNNIVHRQELEQALRQATLWVQTVEGALSLLDPESRELLMALYAEDEAPPISEICRRLGLERSTFYRKKDTALACFTLGLYGLVDPNPCILQKTMV